MKNTIHIITTDEHPELAYAIKLMLVASAYFMGARLGLSIPYIGSHITLIWLPTGIAVASMMRWGYKVWPGVFLGALLANISVDAQISLGISIALGNTLGPVLAVVILRKFSFHKTLDQAYDIMLLAAAAMIGMVISASGGVSSLIIAGILPLDNAGSAWMSWWAGDFVGVLLAAPLLLNLTYFEVKNLSRHRTEFLLWIATMLLASWGVYLLGSASNQVSLPLVFILLPVVVWSAMRFGLVGSSLGVLIPVIIATLGSSKGLGPFYSANIHQSLLLLWLFMTTLVFLNLMVVALQAGLNRAVTALRQSELELRTIIETEPECVKVLAQDGTVLKMNPAGLSMLGATHPEQIIGQNAMRVLLPHHRLAFAALSRRVFVGEQGHQEFEVVGLQGVHRWLETYAVPMRDQQGNITSLLGITRDITERKANEAKIQRMINLYSALSLCNQAIVRCTNEHELFDQVCHDAVDISGFKMAWIGLLDPASHSIHPHASYGSGIEYLQGIEVSVDGDQPSGHGPIGLAIRNKQPYWCQD